MGISGLAGLLGGKSAPFAVFAFFCWHPKALLHSAEAAKKAGLSYGAAFNALRLLEKQGVLERRAVGRTAAYGLRDCAESRAFKVFLNASRARVLLKEFFREGVGLVVLYGSRSRGADFEESDFDVVVVALDKKKFSNEAARLSGLVPQVSVSLFTPLEWERLKRADPAFFERASSGLVLWKDKDFGVV